MRMIESIRLPVATTWRSSNGISASFTYTLWKIAHKLALYGLGFVNHSLLDGYGLTGMALKV